MKPRTHRDAIHLETTGFAPNLLRRHRLGRIWLLIFRVSTIVGIVALTTLLLNVLNGAFGYVAVENRVDPDTLAVNGVPLDELPKDELVRILQENVSAGLFRRLENDLPFAERTRLDVHNLVFERVVEPRVVKQWSLQDSLFRSAQVKAEAASTYPKAELEFKSWLDAEFIRNPQSAKAENAGVRTAILGSLWTVGIAIVFAFPIGVGGAIYLEEYAADTFVNRLIRTNINNLGGVPSIIYGMLGLAIFVRALEPLTSGALWGVADPPRPTGARSSPPASRSGC